MIVHRKTNGASEQLIAALNVHRVQGIAQQLVNDGIGITRTVCGTKMCYVRYFRRTLMRRGRPQNKQQTQALAQLSVHYWLGIAANAGVSIFNKNSAPECAVFDLRITQRYFIGFNPDASEY